MLNLPCPLILASTSRYRRAQLQRLGLAFDCAAPDYDEPQLPGMTALDLIQHHAREKAKAVAATPVGQRAWVLAADQGVVLPNDQGGILLGKPGTYERAVEQLLTLSGRTHDLATAVVLQLPDGQTFERLVVVEMDMRPLSRAEAEAYVTADQPLDCAGSYKIESRGPWILQACRGADPTAIEGLPLLAVTDLLRQALAAAAGAPTL
jgi:septum formation protein